MQVRKQSGFTLVEVIVVAGIIAILAGILVPLILKEIDESRITRAAADVRSITNAIIILKKDTGQWPITATCSNTATLLQGGGNIPTLAAGWDSTENVSFDDYLSSDANGCWSARWKGPYIPFLSADPWGNAYIANATALLSAAAPLPPIWVISAGPDGVVNTPADSQTVQGDDVGLRMR
jgi:general secretion pathway protein G